MAGGRYNNANNDYSRRSNSNSYGSYQNNNNNNTFNNRRNNSDLMNNGNGINTTMLSSAEFEIGIKHMNDRLLFGLVNAIGSLATVTLASGSILTGILLTTSNMSDTGFSIVLKYPEVISGNLNQTLDENLIIYEPDIMMLEFNDIDLSSANSANDKKSFSSGSSSLNNSSNSSTSKFKTDTDISNSGSMFKERELQRWVPDDDFTESGGIEDDSQTFGSTSRSNGSDDHWDQFEVNERKFGIKSTFDENLL
ncbi:unnamed protein product [Ambrosiozyma monospora]|uniref:Unnamed protein product n=1 Tax=Ambrosiozyma monospora TaxID=43982 RepID=A0ACB5T1B4_AMBMO|nr:unnamed protein product [Ambrosiozyma monospora]